MSSGVNKDWINEDNINSKTYTDGIREFLSFLLLQAGRSKYYSCPCRKCKNISGQLDCDKIACHLVMNGMDKSYTLWYFHGETEVGNPTPETAEKEMSMDTTANVDPTTIPIHEQLTDEQPIEDCNDIGLGTASIVSNQKESKHERLKRLAKDPLFPNSKHSTMTALVMLNDLKTECNLSDATIERMLGVLNELLPEGNTMGSKFHEMKSTLKEAHLSCVTYDVCENNCMLFWKDHINDTECAKCKSSRYKVTQPCGYGYEVRNLTTRKRKRGNVHVPKFAKVACKVLRYFPIIPRLQQLYKIKWIAEAMTWHSRAQSCSDYMRHPLDSAEWNNANRTWKSFSSDPRSVRLALATDGFNPYGCFGASYSCWPVILQPLNLPPSLTMKSEFSMLTMLIPGPKSPKSKIDIFLQPLIDDLLLLWDGVNTWDANGLEFFKLKAMLLWCIHDFPAYGMLSGQVVQGKFACPVCGPNTQSTYLTKSRKCCYQCSRMFLPLDHPYRKDKSKNSFNGKEENNSPPRKLEGVEIEGIIAKLGDATGTSSPAFDDVDEEETINTNGYSRRSILFDLPYWSSHSIRHNLDLMHIEKNVTENIMNIILNLSGTKDTPRAREDLKELKIKKKLWLKDGVPPQAPYVLSSSDRTLFLTTLKSLRGPSGFSSSFRNSINVAKKSLAFKSHDYHVIMQHLLPTLLIHAYPSEKPLFKAIQKISIFFNVLCSKVISRNHLNKAKAALIEALCVLETYFPPSFFVIMIHLMHHLAEEALIAGPPRFRSMWTFEREMKMYKKWARNKRYIEGSIAEAYLLNEASLYAMEYISLTGKGTHKRNREAFFDDDDEQEIQEHIGKIHKVALTSIQFVQVRRWILQHQPEYDNWRRMYNLTGRVAPHPSVDDFINWLKEEAKLKSDKKMMRLAEGPCWDVDSYDRFRCNGYSFSTAAYDENKLVQNSGVSVKAINKDGVLTTYYGVIKGIFDLDYHDNTIVVFYCDWVCTEDKTAFRVDPLSKLIMVNLRKVMSSNNEVDEPFILASQASQVFYCQDSKHDGWSIVIPSPKRLTKSVDALEIDQSMCNSILEENKRLCEQLE